MALILDIRADQNMTGVDLKGAYGRVCNLHFDLKLRFLKAEFRVYINKDSGLRQREVEDLQRSQLLEAMVRTQGLPITGWEANSWAQMGDPAFNRDPGATFHPVNLYSDTWAVHIPEGIDGRTEEELFAKFYDLIKASGRFENVRDDV